jgi:hypothetical protein
MPPEEFKLIREALAKGHKGIVREYLDRRIEAFTDAKEMSDDVKPFADKMVQFVWTARKVADLDESLALTCLENCYDIVEWQVNHVLEGLNKIRT